MRVMVIVKATNDSEDGKLPTPNCSSRWERSTSS